MSTKIEDGGPAFPTRAIPQQDSGMSLRDWFAGQIIASLCGGLASAQISTEEKDIKTLAEVSYLTADAMLAARKGGAQ